MPVTGDPVTQRFEGVPASFVDDGGDGTADADWPHVSVVMAVRNEARHLRDAVTSVLAQGYPGPLDVTIAVGPSDDATEDVLADLARDERVSAVGNPAGLTSAGLNAAIAASTGPVVARVDGHAVIPPGYLRRTVELLRETGADNVGGVMAADAGQRRLHQRPWRVRAVARLGAVAGRDGDVHGRRDGHGLRAARAGVAVSGGGGERLRTSRDRRGGDVGGERKPP